MAFPTAHVLTSHLEPLAASHGLDIEHVKAVPAGKKSQVVIRLDGDKRPTSDVLEVLTQEISELFDTLEARGELNFGAGYTLEVSTPGVDLPLELPRHFRRNRGRLIKKGDHVARLGAVAEDEESVILVTETKRGVEIREARLEDLRGAVVEIEFAKPSDKQVEATSLPYNQAAEQALREDEK